MNAFSNSLFTFLFGWIRTLIEGAWNAAAEGRFSGFFSWLGDHWLPLAAFLCLCATALDLLIWLIRWRPYLVWKSALRRLVRRLRGQRVDSARRFTKGYDALTDLEMDRDAPSPRQPAAEPAFAAAFLSRPAAVPEAPAPQEETPPVPQEPAYAAFFESTPPLANTDASVPGETRRHRRSEKYQTVKKAQAAWRQRLAQADDQQEETMLDGLPPAVDREQAFHEPVYPVAQPLSWPQRGGSRTREKNA